MNFSGQRIIREYDRVLVDTCAVVNDGFRVFLKEAIPEISQMKKQPGILYAVLYELRGLCINKHKQDMKERPDQMLQLLGKLQSSSLVQFVDSEWQNTHADKELLRYVILHRYKEHIAVLTQDKKLSQALCLMNSFASFPGKRVDIFFFDSNGNITQYDLKGENTMFDKNAPEMPWLDRDAILCNGFRSYLKNNLQTLINEKKVIFIHAAVRKELEARNDDESGELLAILDTLERNNLLKVMGNKLEPYDSETQYLKAIIRNRTRQKIVFITNNRLLAEDVKMLNDLRSIQGNDVRVCRILNDGSIEDWVLESDDGSAEKEMSGEEKTQRLFSELGW